eukprot:CAMPEP_0195147592 /NCGR_PEP_ID=MMETSP0448-20130528/173690_1 /TAXON_ID=66468 /ORGANISM="Heterocapsa triquestra, Strain CCMP 448" /LENGTH=94 /DNA_ID=CAMNT_0040186179 /DNA_START=24 /DNA_END=305 /DNA_ORIENTATION=-
MSCLGGAFKHSRQEMYYGAALREGHAVVHLPDVLRDGALLRRLDDDLVAVRHVLQRKDLVQRRELEDLGQLRALEGRLVQVAVAVCLHVVLQEA